MEIEFGQVQTDYCYTFIRSFHSLWNEMLSVNNNKYGLIITHIHEQN